MSKLKFEIDLDDLCGEGETIDDHIHTMVDNAIKGSIDDAINAYIEKKIDEAIGHNTEEMIGKIIGERMNQYMDEFFDRPFNQYDTYGDLMKTNVTVKSLLKDKCDNFLIEKVNESGSPSRGYGSMPRIDYMVSKIFDSSAKHTIEKAIKQATDKVKEEANALAVKGLGENLAKLIGKETLI